MVSNKDANIIRFTYINPKTQEKFQFCYSLFKNDFVERFKMVLQVELNKGPSHFRQGLMYGDVFCDQQQIIDSMNKAIDIVNTHRDREWVPLRPFQEMDHKHLMAIHQCFEDVVEDPEFIYQRPMHIKNNLMKVNELIHLYETTLNPNGRFHIDVLFNEPCAYFFEEQDFQLFTPDYQDGYLYLDYGVTGVPVLNAFYEDVKQKPVPQYNYKSGMKLYSHYNKIWGEQDLNELESWLKQRWNLDIQDPKLAIGFIPLGKPTWDYDRNDFAEMIKQCPEILSIEFLNERTMEPQSIQIDYSRLKEIPKPIELEPTGPQVGPSH